MPRTNMDGQSIRRVLEWLLNRDLTDADLAAALDVPPATFSRHKDRDDFPSFEDLERFGAAFEIDARMLQVAFGYRRLDELILLDETAMRQYLQQGGGNYLGHPIQIPSNGKSPPKRLKLARQDGIDSF